MSLRLPIAAVRAYDALKHRPQVQARHSDARDQATLDAVGVRIRELISSYKIGAHEGNGGATFVFWTEILGEINAGSFDDLLDRL